MTQSRTLNVGVVGLGQAATMVIPAMVAMPNVNLVAGADINPRALLAFQERTRLVRAKWAKEVGPDLVKLAESAMK